MELKDTLRAISDDARGWLKAWARDFTEDEARGPIVVHHVSAEGGPLDPPRELPRGRNRGAAQGPGQPRIG